jgi:hypothetical protein
MLAGTPAFGFDPSSIAWMWYDAADTSTISVSGTAVTQWNNKGASGVNLTQGTAANRPTSGTTTLNGRNVISYDGGDVLLGTTPADWKFLHDGTNYVLGFVAKAATVADPENDLQLLSNIRRADAGQIGRSIQHESRSTNVDMLRTYVANGTGSFFVINQEANNVWDSDNPVVYTELTDPDNATAANRMYSYFGTGAAIQNNTQTNAVSTSNPGLNMGIGATDQALQGITGYIAELVIIRGTDATETNRVALRDYLKLKWGL